jgi:hypothetical protein
MDLERTDLAIVGTALIASIAASTLPLFGVEAPYAASSFLILPAGIISLVFVYLAAQKYGGEIARYLYYIGTGIGFFLVSTFPHIIWHQSEMPALGGLDPSFWYVFFHGGVTVSFFLIGYGFYLFYLSGTEK